MNDENGPFDGWSECTCGGVRLARGGNSAGIHFGKSMTLQQLAVVLDPRWDVLDGACSLPMEARAGDTMTMTVTLTRKP